MSCGGQNFEGRECPLPDLRDVNIFSGGIEVKALFRPEYKWKLVEEYGPQNLTVREDGRLYTEWGFSSCEQALRWFLPFGDCVQIIGPQYFREQYVQAVRRMLEPYSEKTGLTEGRREER